MAAASGLARAKLPGNLCSAAGGSARCALYFQQRARRQAAAAQGGACRRHRQRHSSLCRAQVPSSASASTAPTEAAAASDDDIVGWNWTGEDEFTPLGDRKDAPPLPLPRLRHSKRVVLVRHGQSTWNARNRIQGSSNFSVLTDTGIEQAQAAQSLLADWEFECMFVSPLKRTVQTSEIVWGGRKAPSVMLPSLREIDLYSFQGLDKLESRTLYPEQYTSWQANPAEFVIDGHAPVRELWYRASLAWRDILYTRQLRSCGLVVAHNAVNQALLCTALGLPPSFFRRFSQSNAAFTVLDFEYSTAAAAAADGGAAEGGRPPSVPPKVRIERMNQFPDTPLKPGKLGKSQPNRLVLISGSATSAAVQSSLNMLANNGVTAPPMIGIGSPAQQALDIKMALQAALATDGEGRTVLAVASPGACQRLLDDCLGASQLMAAAAASAAGQQAGGSEGGATAAAAQQRTVPVGAAFQMSQGGITIVNWPRGVQQMERGTVLCVNYQLPAAAAAAADEVAAEAAP